MEICSIGASGITAERFFELLESSRVTSIVDTRRHPSSQLAGFTKREALTYFCQRILGVPYIHELLLAPHETDLKLYRSGETNWQEYEDRYLRMLNENVVEKKIRFDDWGSRPVLLCSEPTADLCHRRLAADYLKATTGFVTDIVHL